MLPAAYQVPAAVILLAGGFLACFLGYRLFKVVLGVFGFIIGALAAEVMAEAIVRAAAKAESLNGVPSAKELGTVPARLK